MVALTITGMMRAMMLATKHTTQGSPVQIGGDGENVGPIQAIVVFGGRVYMLSELAAIERFTHPPIVLWRSDQ